MFPTDMLFHPSYEACTPAIIGFFSLITFIQSFRYHPGATMKDLCFIFSPTLADSFHRMDWINVFMFLLPLSFAAVAGTVLTWVLLVAYVQRKWILWSEEDAEMKETLLGRPLLFPCRLTHARMFPEKYNYWINYFLVGIPVGLRGRIGGLMSIDSDGSGPHSPAKKSFQSCVGRLVRKLIWFRIDTILYLHRGDGHLSLAAKLEHFLQERVCTPLIKICTSC